MNITEVTIMLAEGVRLRAFATIVIDGEFLIRDLKVIQTKHSLFVSMPSRKIADHCPECGMKNAYSASYCNECGVSLPEIDIPKDDFGREKLYADICHPIVPECREKIQKTVLEAFYKEKDRYEKEQAEVKETEETPYQKENPTEEVEVDDNTEFSFRSSGTV